MKKLISIILILSSLVLVGCGENEYPPVESTEQERSVVMTMTVGGTEYEVNYELYRALFLTFKSEVDGGDASVWSGDNRDKYIEQINSIIIPKIADIYATLHTAKETGFDFNSKEVEEKIHEFIDESVNGGSHDGTSIEGYGSYDAFLSALRDMGINYAVQIILYKYAIAQDVIDKYYIGDFDEDTLNPSSQPGELKYTEADVLAFYKSGECVRVIRAFMQSGVFDEARANKIKAKIEGAKDGGEGAVATVIIQNTATAPADVIKGVLIGRHSLNSNYYSKMTESAFSLDVGEVSDVIYISTGYESGYFIMYRAEKSDEYFEENYADVVAAYLDHTVGEIISNATDELIESVKFKKAYDSIIHSEISMD